MRAVREKWESRCFPGKGGGDALRITRTFAKQVGPLCMMRKSRQSSG